MSRQGSTTDRKFATPPAGSTTPPNLRAPGAAGAPTRTAGGQSVEMKSNPDAIRRRAYELFLERTAKGRPGDDTADWLQAERELKG